MQTQVTKRVQTSNGMLLLVVCIFCALTSLPVKCFCQNNDTNRMFRNDSTLTETFNNHVDKISEGNKSQTSETKKLFKQLLTTSTLSEQQVDNICNVLNIFILQQRNIEYFEAYIKAYSNFLNTEFTTLDEQVWTDILCTTKYDAFALHKWSDLFTENIITASKTYRWKYSGGTAAIKMEDNMPVIMLNNTDIICPMYDSIAILKCSGKYFFSGDEFVGKGGKITWEKAGFTATQVYAQLPDNYRITLNNGRIDIDDVTLYYKQISNRPLTGSLSDHCMQHEPGNATYPKFVPDKNKRTYIDKMFEDVEIAGGIMLEGSKLSISQTEGVLAEVTISKQRRPFIVLQGERFFVTTKSVSTRNASMLILAGEDTISHPGCLVRYDTDKKQIKIIRDEDKSGAAPFYSSYHKINIYSDEINWQDNIKTHDTTEYLFFSPQESFDRAGAAYFESENFFSEDRFRTFETPDGINMLIQLYNYSQISGTTFLLKDFAYYCKLPQSQVKALLLTIADYRLVEYDHNGDVITIQQKLFDYVANKSKRRDFDNISIYSFVKGDKNAVLNLKTLNLEIRGVDKLVMSSKNGVTIFPTNNKINVANNMNLYANAYISAGLVDIYSKACSFKYNTFTINFSEIDSLVLNVVTDTYNGVGKPLVRRVSSPIEHLNGYLEIDKTYNKSGVMDEHNDDYPRFFSTDSSYVFYQKPQVCNNIYVKNEVYFLLDPFMLSGISSFLPEDISFEGMFVSGGIFRPFREKIKIMDDYSFGFQHTIPSDGYDVYDNSGKMFGDITMSDNCLHVAGKMAYVTADFTSDDFRMFPDSMQAVVNSVVINEGNNKFPHVTGTSSLITFNATKNHMQLNTVTGEPYRFYDDMFALKGTMYYSSQNLKGNGDLFTEQYHTLSEHFTFNTGDFYADSASFQCFSPNGKQNIVRAEVFDAYFNIKEAKGYFHATDNGKSSVMFKENGYNTTYSDFTWDVQGRHLLLGEVDDTDAANVTDGLQVSILPDSLREGSRVHSLSRQSKNINFYTKWGIYDFDKSTLQFNGIDYIKISDAALVPGGRTVTATVGGSLFPFNNGVAMINTDKKYHRIDKLNATIKSSEKFKGSGYYDYHDEFGNVSTIFVELVDSNDSIVRCIAQVPEFTPLALNPAVDFHGTVTMTNKSPELSFHGYYHVKQPCIADTTWITLEDGANPNNLTLPVTTTTLSADKRQIVSGICLSNPGAILYPTFLSTMKKTSDLSLFNVTGMLHFNNSEYLMVDTSNNVEGLLQHHVKLNPETCGMEGAGVFNLIERPGRITFQSAGSIKHNLNNDSLTLTSAMFVDFHFNDAALTLLATDLQNTTSGSEPSDNVILNSAVNFLTDSTTFRNYYESAMLYGGGTEPKLLQSSIVLSKVSLLWDDSAKVFRSFGPIEIRSIKGTLINKTTNGFVEISKADGTESIVVILTTETDWGGINHYFFFYHNNNMFTYSTNEDFSNLIRSDKASVRRLKRKKGGYPAYQYIIATNEQWSKYMTKAGVGN